MDTTAKEDLIKRAGDLKVLPFVARKLLEKLSDDTYDTSSIGEIIEKDQTITARILKISNSALYGLRQEVTSLDRAILILGFKTIRSLVLSVSTRSLYKKFGMTEQMLWDHSVGAAIASRIISTGRGKDVEDIAFIGGLMHDLGKVIMNNEIPEAFAEVMMEMYNEDMDSITAEDKVYGYNHTEVGSEVVAKWGLSPVLITILEKHHLHNGTLGEIREPLIAKGVACINLANHVCKRLGIGYRQPDETLLLHELPSAASLKINRERLDHLVEEISKTYNKEKAVFT